MNNWFVDHHHIFKQTKKICHYFQWKNYWVIYLSTDWYFHHTQSNRIEFREKKIQNTENGKFSIAKHTEKKRVEKWPKCYRLNRSSPSWLETYTICHNFFFCKWRSLTTFSVHRTVYLGQIYTDHLIYGLSTSTSSSPTI